MHGPNLLCVLLPALALACASRRAQAPSHTPTAASEAAPDRLPFLEDDYPRAVAEARARKVPLFVDAWAPW